MGISFTHLIVLALVAILLFGRGRISDLMGDIAKGIKSFKKGLSEEDDPPAPPIADTKKITHDSEMADITPLNTHHTHKKDI